jgi:hypothetical protein
VVSHAIEWAPGNWKAQVDDVHQIATVGQKLLRDRRAAGRGLKALQGYNHRAMKHWHAFTS